jgi:alpha-L-rhamnosidase
LRDDLRPAEVAKEGMMRYFRYLETRRDERGLLEIGLGDWCPANPNYETPLIFTDSTISYDLAVKAAYLYERMGMPEEADYCRIFAKEMRDAIRKHLLEDASEMRFIKGRQSVQAMAIFYGLCDSEEEKEKALAVLLDEIHKQDDHMAVGVLGGRVLFRVLCDYGYEDLATKMITRLDPPSYGVMIADGLTTLAENVREPYGSRNHHFWGDISALMIEYFAGIRVNPTLQNAGNIDIRPVFSTDMQHAKAYYNATVGRVEVAWEREGESVRLRLIYPEGAQGFVIAPLGYTVNGEEKERATSGTFRFFKK